MRQVPSTVRQVSSGFLTGRADVDAGAKALSAKTIAVKHCNLRMGMTPPVAPDRSKCN
jgi:hypothetical protein